MTSSLLYCLTNFKNFVQPIRPKDFQSCSFSCINMSVSSRTLSLLIVGIRVERKSVAECTMYWPFFPKAKFDLYDWLSLHKQFREATFFSELSITNINIYGIPNIFKTWLKWHFHKINLYEMDSSTSSLIIDWLLCEIYINGNGCIAQWHSIIIIPYYTVEINVIDET